MDQRAGEGNGGGHEEASEDQNENFQEAEDKIDI